MRTKPLAAIVPEVGRPLFSSYASFFFLFLVVASVGSGEVFVRSKVVGVGLCGLTTVTTWHFGPAFIRYS